MTFLIMAFLSSLWAQEPWERTQDRLKSVVGDFTTHRLSRIGDQTFELETFISTEGDLNTAIQMLSDLNKYPQWILKNINQKPGGGEFYVKVINIIPNSLLNQITVVFGISVGRFSYGSERTFQMKGTKQKDRFIFEGVSLPSTSSIVSNASGTMTVFPAPGVKGRLWIHIIGRAKLKSKLLYALLPDMPAQNEAGQRVKTAIENYMDWESMIPRKPLNRVETPEEKR